MYLYFVEFGTNTLASLVYFAIPVVANHMRSLGTQVYFSTNTYQLASLVEFRKKIGLASLVEFGTNILASLVYFAIPVVANPMRYLGAQLEDSNGRGN